jgi:hypothetical protein
LVFKVRNVLITSAASTTASFEAYPPSYSFLVTLPVATVLFNELPKTALFTELVTEAVVLIVALDSTLTLEPEVITAMVLGVGSARSSDISSEGICKGVVA